MDQPSVVPEVSEETKLSRRRLLKIAAATGGAVAASTLIPNKWAKPVVDVGLLPAHAQISRVRIGEITCTPVGERCDCTGSEAAADIYQIEFDVCMVPEVDIDEQFFFSGGTPDGECYEVLGPCNGGESLTGARVPPEGCFHVCFEVCVAFAGREHFTYKLTLCVGEDCVSKSVTVSPPLN